MVCPPTKENLGLFTTALDDIVNSIKVLGNEFRNHTAVILMKLGPLIPRIQRGA